MLALIEYIAEFAQARDLLSDDDVCYLFDQETILASSPTPFL
jgi:hypothetical protein